MAIAAASLSALLAYGGQAMVLVFAVIIPGTLLILAAGRAVFAPLFNWSLQHVARLDAAAYARPLIERDIALEVAAEGNFYGRSSFSAESPAGNTAASLWAAADAGLHGHRAARAARRPAAADPEEDGHCRQATCLRGAIACATQAAGLA